MKRGFLVFIALILIISTNAQKNSYGEGIKKGESNFRGGIRAGFTGSQITQDGFPFQGYKKFGGFAGLFVNFPLANNGKWFIQPELNFIMKGCKHAPKFDESGNITGSIKNYYKLQLMYGQIPVLVKWGFYKNFSLEFGPAFGILFKNNDVEKVDGYINYGAPPFARFEFSGILGIEYLFFNHLGVSLRYENSFMPVRRLKAIHWLYLNGGQFNQSFIFNIYYQF